ncbi:Odorant receptor 4 [Anthophora retusa]
MTNKFIFIETSFTNNNDYSLQFNRWFLKPIGAWPSSSTTSRFEKIISIILIVICYSTILFTVIPCIFHMLLEKECLYMKMKVLGPLGHWFVGGINYTTLLLRGKDILYCVKHMENDWKMIIREKDQDVMLKHAKFGRYIAASCAAFMQGGVLCFCLVTALSTEVIQVGNETRIVHLLPCAVYKDLINVDDSPMNEIVLVVQFLSGFIVNSSTVGIFSLAAVLAAHACGQLSVLMGWIKEYVDESSNRKKTAPFNEIGTIVEHHLRALTFISCIEEVMNRICFLELFRCTLDICILGYYILMEWAEQDIQNLTTYFMMLIAICFNIFVICYIGEILTEQCSKVGDVVYMTNWYHLPDKTILDLILIIARSSVVVEITAGKLIHMSVYTFGDVIKTAFGYLNLLRQMT